MSFLCALLVAAVHAKTKFKFGVDINYPPYTYKNDKGELEGWGKDIAEGVNKYCDDYEIETVETRWPQCWDPAGGGTIGAAVDSGELDGCMTYTNTQGIRHNFMEFSWSVLKRNKAAGIITLLDENGEPKLKGDDTLEGKTIVDVGGWAPTADGLGFVKNHCTDEMFSDDYTLLTGDGNDESLKMLFDGKADGVFIYADQAYNFWKVCQKPDHGDFDCNLWREFGKRYAYTQTGQFGILKNGTTVVMAKKGSGVVQKINPCIEKFMASEDYLEVCEKWGKTHECFPNDFFHDADSHVDVHPFDLPTDDHTSGCWDGYCPCTYDANFDGEWDDYDYDLKKRVFGPDHRTEHEKARDKKRILAGKGAKDRAHRLVEAVFNNQALITRVVVLSFVGFSLLAAVLVFARSKRITAEHESLLPHDHKLVV